MYMIFPAVGISAASSVSYYYNNYIAITLWGSVLNLYVLRKRRYVFEKEGDVFEKEWYLF